MTHLSIPYELRVGVTGHRQLADPQAIESAVVATLRRVTEILSDAAEHPFGPSGSPRSWVKQCDTVMLKSVQTLWRSLPVSPRQVSVEQRTPLSWVVVSPLAKGADRIVARAVLSQPQVLSQPKLQVVVPFALEDYRRDFIDPEDRREFEELLQLDASPTVLPHAYGIAGAADTPAQITLQQEIRNDGYLAVGRRVVDACELLIVIWDGLPAVGRGGTADVVRYAVEQRRTICWIDANHPERPPRFILGSAPEPFARCEEVINGFIHGPMPQRAKDLSLGYHRLAAYNRDPAFDPLLYQAVLQRNQEQLLQCCSDAALDTTTVMTAVNCLLPHYARADQLAIRYQQLYIQTAAWLQRLSSIAVTVVVIQVLFFPNQLWLVGFEILAMLSAVILWRISRNEAWHEKWLRDRHFAERLRITLFTTIAQSGSRTASRPDEALPFYQSADDWIIEACDRLSAQVGVRLAGIVDLKHLKTFIASAWIDKQAKYHEQNAKQKRHASHAAHRLGTMFFMLTMLTAALHLFGVGHGAEDNAHGGHSSGTLSALITAFAVALPAWGATIHAVNTLLERERISSRSAQMAKVLKQVAHRVEQSQTPQEFTQAIAQAEELMLMENHEWWVSLSFRPPLLPA